MKNKEKIILDHLDLPKKVVAAMNIYPTSAVGYEDILSAAILGLVEAASRYDRDVGCSFAVYAKHRIKGAVIDMLRSMDCVSRYARDKGIKGEYSCFSEFDTDDFIFEESIQDTSCIDAVEIANMVEVVRAEIQKLPEKIRTAIQMHFFEGMSMSQIAKSIGVSKSTVFYMCEKGIKEIKRQLTKEVCYGIYSKKG